MAGRALIERAPAKINLTLRVLVRRADGWHDIESLVVFADVGDTLTLTPGRALSLSVRGPHAVATGADVDNLVIKAAMALADRVPSLTLGRFVLDKRLPVAAGVGGGSADAAAALRLLAHANRLALNDPRLAEAAAATGADVPVCLDPHARVMRGTGARLSAPLDLPKLNAVLVNPGIALATKDVFAKLAAAGSWRPSEASQIEKGDWRRDTAALIAELARHGNDLEAPAVALVPVIADVLSALRAVAACRLARMSGAGATCFALFDSRAAARLAARTLRAAHPDWWVRGTVLGG